MSTARIATALLTIAAAGGAASTAQAATTQQFARRADRVCRPLEAKVRAIDKPTQPAEVVPYLQKTLTVLTPADTKLKALTLPTQERAQARRGVAYFDKAVKALQRGVQQLSSGADALTTLDAVDKKLDKYGKISDRGFRAVGAKDCVTG